MRKHSGKDYGYVILPVAIPADEDINKTLDDGNTWKVVWEVLNALRSHDPNLAAEINQLVLEKKISKNGKVGEKIRIASITDRPNDPNYQQFLGKFYSKMSSKLVEKVGDINYYDKYGKDIGSTAKNVENRIKNKLEKSPQLQNHLNDFHQGLQQIINEDITKHESIQIIGQHIVMSRIFDMMFSGEFTSHNPISQILEKISKKFGLQEELNILEPFYADAKMRYQKYKVERQGKLYQKDI